MRWVGVIIATIITGCAAPTTPTTVCPVQLDACFASDGWALNAALLRSNASGPWALLVHGLNEDHHSYDKLAADLAAAGWRVLALDSRGHGASTTRTDGSTRALREFQGADFVPMEKDLDGAARFLGAEPRLLVGASVGANEALRHAATHPGQAVVLLSPGLDYRGLATKEANAAHEGSALFVASRDDAYATQSAQALDAAHGKGPHALRVYDTKGHGTNLLDEETRALIVGWANASR